MSLETVRLQGCRGWVRISFGGLFGWYEENNMNGSMVEATAGEMARSTLSDRLETEEGRLTERLEKVKQIRAALDANPEVKFVIDGLAELGHV